jgi:hypothetical protein
VNEQSVCRRWRRHGIRAATEEAADAQREASSKARPQGEADEVKQV